MPPNAVRGKGYWLLALLPLGWVGCGEVGPPEYREQVIAGGGGSISWSGIRLDVPSSGGGERTFVLFHPPESPPPPRGKVLASVGIGPGDFVFEPAATVTVRLPQAPASANGLHLWRFSTETSIYEEIASPQWEVQSGRVAFKIPRGGIYILSQE